MDQIRVLIVEDEWIVSEEIKELLITNGFIVSGQVEDGISALNILDNTEVDVALLDINISGSMDGIELAKEIVKQHNCAIIFLTAFDDEHFTKRAKEVKPAAYIVKPFQERNLQIAIELAFNNLIETSSQPKNDSYLMPDHIFLRDGSRFRKIAFNDIYYAEAIGSYTDIYTALGKSTLAINLKAFESSIQSNQFFRIHRSYLVNLNSITEYEGNRVFINDTAIPISSTNKEEFLTRLKFI